MYRLCNTGYFIRYTKIQKRVNTYVQLRRWNSLNILCDDGKDIKCTEQVKKNVTK